MLRVFETIHQWGRVCLQCGFYSVRPSLLCRHCESTLLKKRRFHKLKQSYHGHYIQGYAHFTWIPNQSRALSLLIESLKGRRMTKAWSFWAGEVLQGVVREGSGQSLINSEHLTPVLVPAPNISGRPDHAFLLARGLHELTGWELRNCLQRKTYRHQKGLDKQERLRVSLQTNEKISDHQAVIFVDDVITTGATAQAAYLALGRPKNFFILTLAYRHFQA